MMSRAIHFTLSLGLLAAIPLPAAPASAELAPAAVTPAAVPLTRDAFMAALGRELAAHFNLDGKLELELLRSWAPPAEVAATWTVDVVDFPSVASSAMMIRCRIAADGHVLAEPTLRQVIAPGVYVNLLLTKNIPLNFLFGAQVMPSLRRVTTDANEIVERSAVRFGVSLGMDIQLLKL